MKAARGSSAGPQTGGPTKAGKLKYPLRISPEIKKRTLVFVW